jgi:adenine-specific DNA-methyltransferase
MILKELTPRKALNKAYLKAPTNRTDIETFKSNLISLLDSVNNSESEEFHKNLVKKFLEKTYYDPSYFINTKGRNDLVIHNGSTAKNSVGIIIEAKSPTNKNEMITTKKMNAKALQELVLYYLRERITQNNLEIKHLVATNINEWFIFDSVVFERQFAQNKSLEKKFLDFENGRLSDTKTDFFYKQIAEPFIDEITSELEFTYFNIQDYKDALRNNNKTDDNALIALYKVLSPEHFLKLPFINDSNSLDKRFYSELLHIIGLIETKDGGKKLIQRNPINERNSASIIEDTIIQLDSLNKIKQLGRPTQYGLTYEEQLYNIGLELSITWINRILFLKLLEAQLISYHKGDKSYSFLTLDKIKNYDDLNSLFFQVLAKRFDERNQDVKIAFEKVPYLNSSLFEPTEIEQSTLFISNLRDNKQIPIISTTVLKNNSGKKLTGELTTLQYLFSFLNAYDFTSVGSEEIQEENKSLINASVLGLIFEKINGYKDGSFFTPGYITMFMSRETIRKSIIQKFNSKKGWNCVTIEEIYNKIEDLHEANEIVNSIKICDPAVGSGHFLVSALNELIAVKSDLNILLDKNGRRLKEYQIEVVNDELIITDNEGELFDYNPTKRESQRVQETLFNEKQTLIENCLFGVDINTNSVKICRLRLWIELLKNSYYKNDTELETLPNIDINIKCGNSLVSRFPIDSNISDALKESNRTIENYRAAVDSYRNAKSKEHKWEMEKLISDIKSDFKTKIDNPFKKKIQAIRGKVEKTTAEINIQKQWGEKINKDLVKELEISQIQLKKLESEREIIESNIIFENAFEWRFEFPEVLNDNGEYIGFDLIIGNPPYINFANLPEAEREYYNKFEIYKNKTDLYAFFVDLGSKIKNKSGLICLIIPHTWVSTTSFLPLRKLLLNELNLSFLVELDFGVFKDAYVKTVIIQTDNNPKSFISLYDENFKLKVEIPKEIIQKDDELKINLTWDSTKYDIYTKIKKDATKLGEIVHFSRGIKTSDDSRFLYKVNKGEDFYKVIRGRNIKAYRIDYDNEFIWYRPDLMKEKAGCLPHSKELFLAKEKIITQRINSSGQLLATYDNDKFFCLDTTNVTSEILDEKCNLKFIVGVMNSKLINWWFNDEFKNPTISGYELHQIPIKRNEKIEISITELVSEILENINSENLVLKNKNEIDELVYELYQLSKEEIEIVEKK